MSQLEKLLETSSRLQQEASVLVKELRLVSILSDVGEVEQVGSSVTGLILNEDIDFKVYTDKPDSSLLATMGAALLSESPHVVGIKVTDFYKAGGGGHGRVGIYFGMTVLRDKLWKIDVSVRRRNETTESELKVNQLLQEMTESQRATILILKSELMRQKRYAGTPKHPLVFNSIDVYRGVLQGNVTNIKELEKYCVTPGS